MSKVIAKNKQEKNRNVGTNVLHSAGYVYVQYGQLGKHQTAVKGDK